VETIMRTLSEKVGPRFSGTEGEHRAAHFLRNAFEAEGVETELQRYRFVGWSLTREPTVTITAPERRKCSAAPIIYSGSTPSEGLTGRLMHHGVKRLIPGVYEMTSYALVNDAGDQLAVLIGADSGSAIPLLNPDPIYQTPLVGIGADDAVFISSQLEDGKRVEATVQIGTDLDPDAFAYNVIARYRGSNSRDRFVVDAHYDTQLDTPGCYDNASGVAGLFGLLRRLREERLPTNVDIVAVAGEEIGMLGSSYLVRDLAERGELRDVGACVCLDQISGGSTLWLWAGPDDFKARVVASAHLANLESLGDIRVDPPMAGCDMWPFWAEGIPAALYMWWRLPDYHKPTDTYDKVEMVKVEGCVDAAFHLLRGLVTA
jgi:Iap family predicted aminopeptidase